MALPSPFCSSYCWNERTSWGLFSIKAIFPSHPTFIFPMPSIHRKSDACRHDFILAPVKSWESRISNTAADLEQGGDWLALFSVLLFMTLCLLLDSIFRVHVYVFVYSLPVLLLILYINWPLRQRLIFFSLLDPKDHQFYEPKMRPKNCVGRMTIISA